LRTIALSFAVEICGSACCQRAIASVDFKAYGSIRQLLGNEFQSLIGILVDFQTQLKSANIGVQVRFNP
jgi:hypothetical protein